MSNPLDKAIEDALVILTLGLKTKKQVVDKLLKKGHEESICYEVCRYLEQHKYLDDALYAQLYVESKSKKYGAHRLKLGLKQKGVSAEDIDKGFESQDEPLDETERARALLEQKIKNTPIEWERLNEDYSYKVKIQSKLLSYLASRGFSSSVVYSVVRNRLAEQFIDEF